MQTQERKNSICSGGYLRNENVIFEEFFICRVQDGIGRGNVCVGVYQVDVHAQIVFRQNVIFVVLLQRSRFILNVSNRRFIVQCTIIELQYIRLGKLELIYSF